jgi:hypothetical protein
MSLAPTSRIDKRRHKWAQLGVSASAVALLGFAALAGGNSGCGSDQCLSNNQFYEQKVWAEVVAKVCIKCHAPEGAAASVNAKFLQYSQAFPGFLDLNLSNITEVAKIQYDGTSELLLKPTGKISHGGGIVIDEGSPEYKILEEMVERASSPVTCSEGAMSKTVDKVNILSPVDTLRKASLHLAGRLPTDAEIATVEAGGEEALGAALDSLMNEEAFFTRLKEIYGDTLLTGRYNGNALNILSGTDYPNRSWFNPTNTQPQTALQDTQERWSDYGIAAEPLELIAHVARNNRPFSEILTANYTVVNPYSARVYGLDPATLGFTSLTDYYQFREAKVSIAPSNTAIPHAGVLTTPVYLNRYPTTTTNLNRARARFTFKFFLATDLLAVAERPIDPSAVTSTNPTRDDQYCTSCHKIIDPVASTYQKWDASGRYNPMLNWPQAMPQPGFGTQIIDNVATYPSALQWLGQRLVQDPRFATSVLNIVYKGIMGQDPLPYPVAGDPDFVVKQTSWQDQNRVFQAVLDSYNSGNQNVKLVFKGLITSPLYRAYNSAADLNPVQAEAYGTGRLLTPELLSNKIAATLGAHWWRYDKRDVLPTDYNLLYGGIDFDNVTKRLTVPNSIIASVAQRMANEMSCNITAWDFTKKPADRKLFKFVEVKQAPEDDNGYPVPDAVNNIRRNIQYLHLRILGEHLDENSPEVERTFQVFLKTWRELHAAANTNLAYDCQGRWNRETGDPLMAAEITVTDDRYYTVRSWMAVITFLLMDWNFLFEQGSTFADGNRAASRDWDPDRIP